MLSSISVSMKHPMSNWVLSTSFVKIILLVILILTLTFTFISCTNNFVQYDRVNIAKALAQKYPEVAPPSNKGPIIVDPHLKAEVVFTGLKYPTSMAFLGPNDILVTEKDTGTVRRIMNGTELPQPLLNASVSTYGHRGMLGITVASNSSSPPQNITNNHVNTTTTYVFLYYTQARTHTGDDISEGKQPLGNRVYRYELIDNKLVNPRLLLDLPATPGAIGNGGKVIVGPDNNIYLTI